MQRKKTAGSQGAEVRESRPVRGPVGVALALILAVGIQGMLPAAEVQAVSKGYLPRAAFEARPYVPPPPPEPKVHFVDNGDGTLTDDKGLMWTQRDSYAHMGQCMSWYQSMDYVQRLNEKKFAGHADWRMPSMEELAGIYDDTMENVIGHDHDPGNPLHLDGKFAAGAAYWYWSSETEETNLTDCCARSLYFVTGQAFSRRLSSCMNGGVRAVRTVK